MKRPAAGVRVTFGDVRDNDCFASHVYLGRIAADRLSLQTID